MDVIGLDPDPKALERARRKAHANSVAIQLDRGFSNSLPYPDASFDRVFSCFMFHHLETAEEKQNTFREIRRVLRPGGRLHLLDFVRSEAEQSAPSWLHSNHRLDDNTEPRMLSLIGDAGLVRPTIITRTKLFLPGPRVVLGERHLRRVLTRYLSYDHASRTHRPLDEDVPASRRTQHTTEGPVVEFAEVGGLHHRATSGMTLAAKLPEAQPTYFEGGQGHEYRRAFR